MGPPPRARNTRDRSRTLGPHTALDPISANVKAPAPTLAMGSTRGQGPNIPDRRRGFRARGGTPEHRNTRETRGEPHALGPATNFSLSLEIAER